MKEVKTSHTFDGALQHFTIHVGCNDPIQLFYLCYGLG
jgi:hypothetical protein